MFSNGPPGSRHLPTDGKRWKELERRIESFLDEQYAAVDRDKDSDEWDILDVERWDPWLESRTEEARQAKDAQAPDSKQASAGVRKTTLFEPCSGSAGPNNRDFEFKSIWEVDWLEPGPVAGDAKEKMVEDWVASQIPSWQRKSTIRSCSPYPDSDLALRSDDLRPLRHSFTQEDDLSGLRGDDRRLLWHSRSPQEDDLAGLRYFDSFDKALCPNVAGVDPDERLRTWGETWGGSGYGEDMNENALPRNGSIDVVLPSTNSGSAPRNMIHTTAPNPQDSRISDGG